MVLVEGKAIRRRMTKFRINHLACVDKPAMEPALAVILKRDDAGDVSKVLPKPGEDESRSDFVARFMDSDEVKSEFGSREQRLAVALETFRGSTKDARLEKFDVDAVPLMTEANDGHAHLVWLRGERGGVTSFQVSEGKEQGHDHPWTIDEAGNLVVGMAEGHDHGVATESVLAAMRELLLQHSDAPEAVVDVVFARAPDDAGEPVSIEKLDDVEAVEEIETGRLFCKNTKGELLGEDPALPDGSFPIRCEADLLKAISLVDSGEWDQQVVQHVVRRARVLGLEKSLPNKGAISEVAGAEEGINPMTRPTDDGGGDVQKQLDEAKAEIEKLKGDLTTVNKVAALSPEHRAHYEALGTDEKKATFLEKKEPEKQAEVDEVAKGDPVVYEALDGTEYRKSAGEHFIALAKKNDELEKRLRVSEAERSNAALEKRAQDELGALPGDLKVRSAVLKAVDSIEDDEIKKGAMALLKAGNDSMSKKMQRMGVRIEPTAAGGSDREDADAELTRLAKEMVEKDTSNKLDFYDAYDRAAELNPELAKRAIGNSVPMGG